MAYIPRQNSDTPSLRSLARLRLPISISMSQRQTPMAKELPKHFAAEKYLQACKQPWPWLVKAREMRRAADLVWTQFSFDLKRFAANEEDNGEPFIGGVAMMLYAFAAENLLKAGLVARGDGQLSNGNFALKSHKLEDLANDLGLILDAEERELLERLENFLEWAGRYPIPLIAEGLYSRAMLDGSKTAMYGVSSADQLRVDALLTKIQTILPNEEQALQAYVRETGTCPSN